MWFATGFVFMWYVHKYHRDWWVKYNYITSAAFDSGVAIAGKKKKDCFCLKQHDPKKPPLFFLKKNRHHYLWCQYGLWMAGGLVG